MIGKKINQLATELAPLPTDLTIIGDPTTGVSKKITLEQISSLFGGSVSFYTNLAIFPAVGNIDIIYCAKDTNKLYLWGGSSYVEVFPSQALLNTYQLRSEKGVSNGYASLDSGGKVPISQLPSSIMEYKGTWNAATNTPTLANGTGDTGDVYICNVAGTVNFGAGPITFAVGDYTIYSGSIWQRSSGAVGTVTSVAVSRSGDALAITGSPITTSGTINIGFAGTGAQYIKGDGTLATFPSIISQATNLITEVYNNSGATLTKGTIVYINGGQGNLPTVAKALATGDSTSAQTFGVVQADITNMNNGYVVVAGRISDLDTQVYANGTQLYLSPTTAGTWTSTKPYAPQHLVYVGIVVRAHPTQGVVEVKIQNGYEMDELHNVAAQSPDNNDILQYKTATSLWTKVAGTTSNIAEGSNLYYTDARSRAALSFTAGSGAYNSTTGVITIPTNTNQLTNGAAYITLASLSAGAGISYNNTTGVIASTITQYTDAMARASISGGTGISYNSTTGVITNTITQYTDAMARASISLTTTGTSGAATYNSTTGVLNVPQYAPDLSGYVPTSRTLTINGTAFDLSANRSWSVGTVTSVGLSSSTSGVTIGSTPITTSGTITLAIATASGLQQGLLSSTDWTTFNNKQGAITLTTTGTSGAATLVGNTLNIPQYSGGGGGISGSGTANQLTYWDSTSSVTGSATLTYTPASQLLVNNSITASGAIARGISLTPTLSAAANGDVLVGLDITPTFTNGAFSNITNAGIRISGQLYIGLGKNSLSTNIIIGSVATGRNISSGAGNTFVGMGSGSTLSSGSNNTAFGQGSLGAVSSTSNNTAFGQGSLSNTSGTSNTAIGQASLNALSSGSNNIALGWQAGRYITSTGTTANQTTTGSIYLGYDTRASANGNNNEIVISGYIGSGSGQVGLGTNTTSIGNSSTTGTFLYGRTILGGTVDNGVDRLQVNGSGLFSSSVTATNVGLGSGFNLTWGGAYGANIPTIIGVSGASGFLTFYPSGSSYGEAARFTNNGNFGIGTTSPNAKLAIDSAASATSISDVYANSVIRSAGGGGTLSLLIGHDSSVNRPYIQSATSTTPFNLLLNPYGGNVGIGTTSPAEKLDVIGGAVAAGNGTIRTGITYSSLGLIGTFTNHDLGVITNGTERMRITSGGNVGIGTTSPSEKLEVNGNIKASNLYSGTYTPTITLVTNAASSTAYVAQYYRVGNVVTVSGVVTVAASVALTNTRITMSLPINSNFDYSYRAGGGGGGRATSTVCIISASGSASTVQMDFVPSSTGSTDYFFSYTYQIL